MPPEKVRLRIGNLAKAVLVSGQAYQDPKDALNEFVSNAADEYAESGRTGERVRVVLRRTGRYPVIAVDDSGRGLSPDRLREVDLQTADRLADAVRRIFGMVLRELADIDNPMRSALGSDPGEGALFAPGANGVDVDVASGPSEPQPTREPPIEAPSVDDLLGSPAAPIPPPHGEQSARPDRSRSTSLPSVAPDPTPGDARSRYDPEQRLVLYNDRHADYLLVKDDETALLDYLATLVAKEYVLYNNARASSDEFAEEMVRMLVRVRRHMPRRR